eukprot:2766146-Pyramimonas_sp.AAC.1
MEQGCLGSLLSSLGRAYWWFMVLPTSCYVDLVVSFNLGVLVVAGVWVLRSLQCWRDAWEGVLEILDCKSDLLVTIAQVPTKGPRGPSRASIRALAPPTDMVAQTNSFIGMWLVEMLANLRRLSSMSHALRTVCLAEST